MNLVTGEFFVFATLSVSHELFLVVINISWYYRKYCRETEIGTGAMRLSGR